MTASSHPSTVDEYVDWAKTALASDFGAVETRTRYVTNLQSLQNTVQESPFMRNLNAYLAAQNTECQRRTGAELLMSLELTILKKPFSSAVEKSFRQNVLDNRRFPDPPNEGWVTPDTWYGRFNDLVRGTLICRFFDGPSVLANSLDLYAAGLGLKARHYPRSNERGYYAFHHYTEFPAEILDNSWNTQPVQAQLEIQLTTQLQEVLRALTHPLYEGVRTKARERDESWKWEHETARFRTSYLGHTLHMIEAIILQVRDSVHLQVEADAAPPQMTEGSHTQVALEAQESPAGTETKLEREDQ